MDDTEDTLDRQVSANDNDVARMKQPLQAYPTIKADRGAGRITTTQCNMEGRDAAVTKMSQSLQ